MKISKKQAEILLALLAYDEIRWRDDGFYFEGQGVRVHIGSLNGLVRRGLLAATANRIMPSLGHCASVFYDEHVTKKGREAFLKYVEGLPSWNRSEWLQKAKALEEKEYHWRYEE